MPRIGAYNGHVTILVTDGLWLQSKTEDAVDIKMKQPEILPHLRESFPGARSLLNALSKGNVSEAKAIITQFHDAVSVGKFNIIKTDFNGELEPLWGYPPRGMQNMRISL